MDSTKNSQTSVNLCHVFAEAEPNQRAKHDRGKNKRFLTQDILKITMILFMFTPQKTQHNDMNEKVITLVQASS